MNAYPPPPNRFNTPPPSGSPQPPVQAPVLAGSTVWIIVLGGLLLFAFLFYRQHAAPLASSNTAAAGFSATDADAIRAMMLKSAQDWNRGDLDAFATSYKNSPDILFIGHHISRGYAQMLQSYKQGYSTREQMGVLTFSELAVQPLDANFATLTGKFHLERSTAGGGNADGHYLLVVERTDAGWKIVRDDSTADPVAVAK